MYFCYLSVTRVPNVGYQSTERRLEFSTEKIGLELLKYRRYDAVIEVPKFLKSRSSRSVARGEFMQNILLPDRYPNADFFIADIFDAIPVKGDRHTMEHPFFALSTKKDIRSIEYEREGVKISLSPSAKYGLPTMMDKDILLFVGSLLMREINAGRLPPKTVRFSAHDLMVTTNRETNGKAYRLLKDAFERVTGCMVTTSIKTKDYKGSSGFHILESYDVIESSRDGRRMVRVEVTVSDWFYNALIGREVLTLNREYFRLRKPLERRLYELARKHCGKQPAWQIGLDNLREKCGSLSPLKNFRFQMKEIIAAHTQAEAEHKPAFPDYVIAFETDTDLVTFKHRLALLSAMIGQSLTPTPVPVRATLSAREHLSHTTFLKAKNMVEDAWTGWDLGALIEQFNDQLNKGFHPRSLNAAFLGFVRKKVQQRP